MYARDSFKSLTELFTVLSTSRVWKSRLVSVGTISSEEAVAYGATGPIARSAGIKKDVRFLRSETYSHYWFLSIRGYLGKRGDCFDRFLIRIREMYESVNIIFQILSNLAGLSEGSSGSDERHLFSFFNFAHSGRSGKIGASSKYASMEALIRHFKHYSEGVKVPRGFAYRAVEAPKGEFGVSIVSDGTAVPYRCKIRTPGYHNLLVLPRMAAGHLFADLVTVIGSQDIVFGDVDR